MRLLLDQNLSPRLLAVLADLHPGSTHVREVGLQMADDETVWRYAADHGFTIVSKDADFRERSFLLGHPPKVVWIRRGSPSPRLRLRSGEGGHQGMSRPVLNLRTE